MIIPKVALLALVCTSVAFAAPADPVSRLQALGVEAQGVEMLLSRMDEAGISKESREDQLNRLAALAQSGLPVQPVLNRYLEGFAKRVPLPRIEAVVDKLSTRLAQAAVRVDEASSRAQLEFTPQERLEAIDQACYALGVGVGEDELTRSLDLACLSRAEGYAAHSPLVTMSGLVSAGISSDRSFNVLHTAWDRGYRGRDLELLGRAVAGFDASGEAADMVVDLLVADQSLDAVFQNLETLQGAPKSGFTPGEIHDPPSGKRILPREDKDPNPVTPQRVGSRT